MNEGTSGHGLQRAGDGGEVHRGGSVAGGWARVRVASLAAAAAAATTATGETDEREREREIAQHKLGVWKRLAERRRQEQQQPQRKEGSEAREESECLVPDFLWLISHFPDLATILKSGN